MFHSVLDGLEVHLSLRVYRSDSIDLDQVPIELAHPGVAVRVWLENNYFPHSFESHQVREFKLTNIENPTKVALSAVGNFMLQSLRKAGGSLVMTIPKVFVEQNRLFDGAQVTLHLSGTTLRVEAPNPPRYRLTDLMAEMPDGLPRVERWDALSAVGLEQD